MHDRFCASDLVPRGFVVNAAVMDGSTALITVRAVAKASLCPGCGARSERVHSRYRRCLADLPIAGRPVRLMVLARRFYCKAVLCGRLLTIGRDRLSKSETVTVAAVESGVPLLVEAREIVAEFQAMVRKRCLDALHPWLERARSGLVASFVAGVLKDKAAAAAAITSPWPNGQTEGQITKLKLVKRQMYGRGKLDLLQARVIGAT